MPLPPTVPPAGSLSAADAPGSDPRARASARRGQVRARRLTLMTNTVPAVRRFASGLLRQELINSLALEGQPLDLPAWLHFELLQEIEPNVDPQHLQDMRRLLRGFHLARRDLTDELEANDFQRIYERFADRTTQQWLTSNPAFFQSVWSPLKAAGSLPRLIRLGILYGRIVVNAPNTPASRIAGRMLIPAMAQAWGLLPEPMLGMSDYLTQKQAERDAALIELRDNNNMAPWLNFFVEGGVLTLDDTLVRIGELLRVVDRDRTKVLSTTKGSLAQAVLFEKLVHFPVATVAAAAEWLKVTKPTASKAISALVKHNVLEESTGRGRDRIFHYQNFLRFFQRPLNITLTTE